jgi:hypothetical protein
MTTWSTPAYDGWATVAQAKADNAQLRPLPDAVVERLLAAAYESCRDFAPPVAVVDGVGTIPESYVRAQIMQADALRKAGLVGTGDNTGGDFPVTVYPLDWNVKQLLRPSTGTPGMW